MSNRRAPVALIRGGGELATGAAHALAGAGARILVLERPRPTALRLGVAFASAAIHGRITVGGIEAVLARSHPEVATAWQRGQVAVWTRGTDELERLVPDLLIDGRLRQLSEPITTVADGPCVIGIGPGFEVGRDAHFVIESNRGPTLGQVLTSGHAEPHTGIPGDILGYREQRILRAPLAGEFVRRLELGDFVAVGEVVGEVAGAPVRAALSGMVRGLKLTGVPVGAGHKVGDVDPRRDRALLTTMTDKAVAIGRGVVRAATIGGVLLGPARVACRPPRERTTSPREPVADAPAGVTGRRKEGSSCT